MTSWERVHSYFKKAGRGIHFFSRLEFHVGLEVIEEPDTEDLLEEFPLPQDETLPIAKELGIVHPRDPDTLDPIVMTTDLIAIKRSSTGYQYRQAIPVKYQKDARKPRNVAKRRIEEEWHHRHGNAWRPMSEADLSPNYVSNLRWIHPLQRPDAVLGFSPEIISRVDTFIRSLALTNPLAPLPPLASRCDAALAFKLPGSSLYIARYLISMGLWRISLRQWLRGKDPLSQVLV